MPLSADQLVTASANRTGLAAFGAPGWEEGLAVLVDSANSDADLNPVGEMILSAQISQSLDHRLQVVDFRALHPDVEATPVANPVFILGLPRTGTTLLSYLLAQDTANRSLRRWEAFGAVPPPLPGTADDDPRVQLASQQMAGLYAASPEFAAIHYEDATGPTECVTLLGQEFRSVHFETLATLGGYGAWHQDCDMVPAYVWQRQVLEVLQHRDRGRWVLKSPCHNLALPALLEVFPDARFIVPHRDPIPAVVSLASLVHVLSGLGTDVDHRIQIGDRWLELAGLMTDRLCAVREEYGSDRFFDVPYRALAADPVGTAASIYQWLGWELTDDTNDRMATYLQDRPQGHHGDHRYLASDYGLTETRIRAALDRYLADFAHLCS